MKAPCFRAKRELFLYPCHFWNSRLSERDRNTLALVSCHRQARCVGVERNGMVGYTVNKVKTFFEEQDFPKEALDILNRYKKMRV